MQRQTQRLLATLLVIVALCGANVRSQSQHESKPTLTPKPTPTPTPNLPLAPLQREFKSLPFAPGEKLVYEVKYTRFPISAKVGEVTFEYAGEFAPPPDKPALVGLNASFQPAVDERLLHLRAAAVSKGVLIAILGLDVKNRYEALTEARDFSARLGVREIKEGKKNIVQSVLFDRARQTVTYTAVDPANPKNEIPDKVLPRADGMLGLLSAFYFVRLQKLKENTLLRFPVSDDGANYTFEIMVEKREQLKTDCGKLRTIKLEPKLFGPGQLLVRPGQMWMWLTDNKAHIPVKIIAKTGGGTVSVRLLDFKQNCQIAEPGKDELQ